MDTRLHGGVSAYDFIGSGIWEGLDRHRRHSLFGHYYADIVSLNLNNLNMSTCCISYPCIFGVA